MAADKTLKHDLRRDVLALKKGETVLETWPQLADYPDLKKYGTGKDGDLLLRYCILLTDPGSGYLTIANIELRHLKAWADVGLPNDEARKAAAFDFSDVVAAMCYALLEADESMMLAYVLGREALLWKELRKMRSLDESEGKALDELPDRIRALQLEKKILFSGDKGLEEAVKAVAKATQYTAESLARETPVVR